MKKHTIIAIFILMTVFPWTISASGVVRDFVELSGRVVSASGEPVAYATVVFLNNGEYVTGTVSEDDGSFKLSATAGTYLFKVNCIGYNEYERSIDLSANIDLGTVILEESSTHIEDIVVKGRVITREPDRFVINVAGSNVAVGKNLYEMIGVAPGVRADDSGIAINGRGGTKVMIGERLLKMSDDELIAYLESIPAENVQKIEVIPIAGADQDADSSGGIVKITLKKQREDGLDGNITLPLESNDDNTFYDVSPRFNLNYKKNKLNLYMSGSYTIQSGDTYISEDIKYFDKEINTSQINSLTKNTYDNDYYRMGIGFVYDVNDKHSFGAEAEYTELDSKSAMDGNSIYDDFLLGNKIQNDSDYSQITYRNTFSSTVNYIIKLDTVGSTFKIIGDYLMNNSGNKNLYINGPYDLSQPSSITDSFRKSDGITNIDIFTVNVGVEKILNPKTKISFGSKFSSNSIYSDMRYYNSITDEPYEWIYDDNLSSPSVEYTENIGALYFIYNKQLGRFSLSAGLRGEYTDVSDVDDEVEQRYFDLFPNTTLSYNLNKKGDNMLIAQYSRNLSRPPMSKLNNNRMQLSEYTYVIGNPKLRPMYTDNISFTTVFKSKYTLSLLWQIINDMSVEQMFISPEDENKIMYQTVNVGRMDMVGASMSLPFDVTKWLSVTGGLLYLYVSDYYNNSYWLNEFNVRTYVTLPKNFFFEANVAHSGQFIVGNISQKPRNTVNLSLKKRLLDNKLTMSLMVKNLLNTTNSLVMKNENFVENYNEGGNWTNYSLSISYNFLAGKRFSKKTVEQGASAEKSRL